MKNNRGQALVEFVIILPIFLLLVISVIDLGNIISKRYSLENDIDIITDMYKDEKYEEINTYTNKKNINVSYEESDGLFVINLEKRVKIISPMLNLIFGNNYKVNIEKSFYKNEQ